MPRFPSLSLHAHLQLALAVMILPLLVVGVTAALLLQAASRDSDRAAEESVRETTLVNEARAALSHYEQLASNVETAEPGAVRLRLLADFRRQNAAVETRLLPLVAFDDGRERELAVASLTALRRAQAVLRLLPLSAARPDGINGDYRLAPFHADIARAMSRLDELSIAGSLEATGEVTAARNRAEEVLRLLAALLVASLIAATASARHLSRRILGPLASLKEAAGRLGDEDLSARVPVGRKDELGQVSESFNAMAERLARDRDALAHQAFHDALTGLANRELFADRAKHALERARGNGATLAVLFADVDDFKTVNDSLGHSLGDQLLQNVARRIESCLRPSDTAARLGGDEFALLLEGVDTSDAARVAQRVIEQVGEPFTLQGKEVFVRASIGIAFSSTGQEDADELLRNADVAMYLAKGNGKGRFELFEPEMHAAVVDRLDLEADLRAAVEHHQFVLHYQPIVDLRTGAVACVEALVRWQHPRRGLVPPLEFIPIAEKTGLIEPIGRWVLEEACRQLARWQARLGAERVPRVSVNLSMRQFEHPRLVESVAAILRRCAVDPGSVVLELTESVLMKDAEATIGRLEELSRLGVRLAIDDFGTGYSSFSYLRRFPIDLLKIDKSFLSGVGASEGIDSKLTQGILELAQTLELSTVAEGIEEGDQVSELRGLGCDLGQGFFFARPAPAEEVEALLVAWNPVRGRPDARGSSRTRRLTPIQPIA